MGENPHPLMKAKQCVHYADYIAIAEIIIESTFDRLKGIDSHHRRSFALHRNRNNNERHQRKRTQLKKKTFATEAFGSRLCSPSKLNLSMHSLKLFGVNHTFVKKFTCFFGVIEQSLVFTDNNLVTRLFREKEVDPVLWNSCHYLSHFGSEKVHLPRSMNAAADCL